MWPKKYWNGNLRVKKVRSDARDAKNRGGIQVPRSQEKTIARQRQRCSPNEAPRALSQHGGAPPGPPGRERSRACPPVPRRATGPAARSGPAQPPTITWRSCFSSSDRGASWERPPGPRGRTTAGRAARRESYTHHEGRAAATCRRHRPRCHKLLENDMSGRFQAISLKLKSLHLTSTRFQTTMLIISQVHERI